MDMKVDLLEGIGLNYCVAHISLDPSVELVTSK